MRRLQRIRDTTAAAIQSEIQMRREAREDFQHVPAEVRRARDLRQRRMMSAEVGDRAESSARVPSTLLGDDRTFYRAEQRDRSTQTTGPSFAPVVPEVRTEIRTEWRIPERVYTVPGGQCYHVFNPCHAFRHRGTQERVQTMRICEYCVRHQGRDPMIPGPGIDELLRRGEIPNFDRPGVQR